MGPLPADSDSMTGSSLRWYNRFVWLALFAIAMGFLEGIVVIYLRELIYPEGFTFPLHLIPAALVRTEWIREGTTLVMLAAVGILTGRNTLQRLFYALFAFGIWDITYYASLSLLIGWPPTLLTWDLLFLIPVSWLGPVLAPMINSLTMIIMALLLIGREESGHYIRAGASDWVLMTGGAAAILCTYLADYTGIIIRSGILKGGGDSEQSQRLAEMITTYIPEKYRWHLFIIGELLIIAATINILIRSRKYSRDEKTV